jgi:uncharacterized protein YbaR (Trm112 family)
MYQNWDLWFENIPTGNPGHDLHFVMMQRFVTCDAAKRAFRIKNNDQIPRLIKCSQLLRKWIKEKSALLNLRSGAILRS